ncbi:peptide deformylase, mitochondrial-like [Anopheles ziemanni]|uniref:peptide deformylase, mitochondrial-like n=1 Tax=Anopheles coustani TaxID=139045 RepID=UPI00265A58FC|nr:peptide deformylase, mitochondrial-like [Anopheles coustani]XP_058172963.1 peptide deformylase, mitochondrial-like [Anopheles ziemanni]
MLATQFKTTIRAFSSSARLHKSLSKWYQGLWQTRKNEPPFDHIVQLGDPALRQVANLIPERELKSPEVQYLVKHLTSVMRAYKCVGLAAPQLGLPLRAFVMEFKDDLRDQYTKADYKLREMEPLPLTVFLNPEIKVLNYDKLIHTEACESVRGYRADVARYREVLVKGYDRHGERQELKLHGWNARIAQHEMDHLNGIVYTDIMNRKSFTCTCWEAVNAKQGRVNLSFAKK